MRTSGHARTTDGRRLHYVEDGEGDPTVVFEVGMGGTRSQWGLVLPRVAEHTRAVAYDRAGLGRSDPDPGPRTVARAAGDLVDLVGQLGQGPVVLVGHSWGGPIVRLAAARLGARVRGLVLVDPSDETCPIYYSSAMRQQRWLVGALPVAARLGLVRAVLRRAGQRMPADVAAELVQEEGSVASARAFQREMASMEADLRALLADPPDRADVPLTIISGTRKPRLGAATRASLITSHGRRAAAHPLGRHVYAERSTHPVHLSEPQVVVDEVLRLIQHP